MKEIGGYFQLDQLIDEPFHKNLVELNTARNALLYLVKSKNIGKVYLPYFLCDSVSSILSKNPIEYDYYEIDRNFRPIFNEQ